MYAKADDGATKAAENRESNHCVSVGLVCSLYHIMAQGFSKRNQSSPNTAYRFGGFELYPQDRLLKRAGLPIQLQPKSFDALLCLVRRAQHLVSQEELIATLSPSVSVSDANLTNTIVSLRKV